MNIFKAYYKGLTKAIKLPRPVFLIYFINLLIGILIAIPLFGLMDGTIGKSLVVSELLKGFNTTIFSDFIAESSGGLKVIVSQIKWIMLIYWFLSIFLAGGIIRTLNQDKFTMTSFFSGAGYNFFRYLGISLVMLIIQIMILLLVYVPTFAVIKSMYETASSEIILYRIFFTGFTIHLILFLILLMVNDYAKFYAALYDRGNFIKAVFGGFAYVFKNFFRTFGLYLILVILPAVLLWGYFRVDTEIGTHTKLGVLIMFLIQQAVIFLRIWFRIWIYSSPLQMYTDDFLKQDDVKNKLALMNEWNKKAGKQKEIVKPEIVTKEVLVHEKIKVYTEEEILEQMKKNEEDTDDGIKTDENKKNDETDFFELE